MPIMVHTFFNIFTNISKFLQPVYGSPLANAAVFTCQVQGRQNNLIDILAELLGRDHSQILSSKIPPHCMQDILVIQQCVLAMVRTHFTWWQLLMLKQMPLIPADLAGKIFTLPHSSGNCKTGTHAWPSAFGASVVAGSKLHVFSNCSKLSHHLNSAASLQLYDFFQTPDNFQDIC